jgi:hypothetical protein
VEEEVDVDVVVGDDETDGVGALGVGGVAAGAGAGTADEGAGGAAFVVAVAFFVVVVVAAFFTFFSFLGLSSTPGCLNSAAAAHPTTRQQRTRYHRTYAHAHERPGVVPLKCCGFCSDVAWRIAHTRFE